MKSSRYLVAVPAALALALAGCGGSTGSSESSAPAGSAAPAAGLISADIGPEHRLGEDVILRGTVLGAGEAALDQGDSNMTTQIAGSAHLRAMRLSTQFSNRGLQGVQLGFSSSLGQQSKSLFTLVRGPARLLVFLTDTVTVTFPSFGIDDDDNSGVPMSKFE